MQNKLRERLIKEIVIESNNLLELVQWNDQPEDLVEMRNILTKLEIKCADLGQELGQ